jgi:hypothetical protein
MGKFCSARAHACTYQTCDDTQLAIAEGPSRHSNCSNVHVAETLPCETPIVQQKVWGDLRPIVRLGRYDGQIAVQCDIAKASSG